MKRAYAALTREDTRTAGEVFRDTLAGWVVGSITVLAFLGLLTILP